MCNRKNVHYKINIESYVYFLNFTSLRDLLLNIYKLYSGFSFFIIMMKIDNSMKS